MSKYKQKLDDIFNDIVPKDGSNVKTGDDDANGYSDIVEGEETVSFENKIEEINDLISSAPSGKILPKTESVKTEDIPKVEPVVESKDKKEDSNKAVSEPASKTLVAETKPANTIDDILGEVISSTSSKTKENKVSNEKSDKAEEKTVDVFDGISLSDENLKQSNKTEETVKEDVAQKEIKASQDNVENPKEIKSNLDEDGWCFTSPSAMFDDFYAEKKIRVKSLLRGQGRLPCDKFYRELKSFNADINIVTWDLEKLSNSLREIQSMRERCKQIILDVTYQYYLWESFLPLMEGLLASVEYVRGKQQAVVYKHLGDIIEYHDKLKITLKQADIVYKTLDGAFECLSRQVTIAMPNREPERFKRKEDTDFTTKGSNVESRNVPAEIKEPEFKKKSSFEGMEDFDGLSEGSNLDISKSKKSIPSGWDVVK